MSHFKEIYDLPIYENLLDSLDDSVMHCLQTKGQVCINTVSGYENDFMLGVGSLLKNWEDKKSSNVNGISKIDVPDKKDRFFEKDFTVICNQFKDSPFEDIFESLKKRYDFVGRVRLFKSEPLTCLSWHNDYSKRVHYPIKTQEGCLMIIDDEVTHLKQNIWYETDTSKLHTALNASKESRIHLVGVV